MQHRKTIVATALAVAFIAAAALPARMSTTDEVACHAEGCRRDLPSLLASTPPSVGRQLPVRRLSMEEVRDRIHPDAFQSLGARSYQFARVGDIRPPGDALEYVKERLAMSANGDGLATFDIYLTVMDCRSQLGKSTHGPGGVGTPPPLGMVALQTMERKLQECSELYGDAGFMDHDVAATGNLDAIFRLSLLYERGFIVQKNAEMAYAYALAANRIQPGLSGPLTMRALEEGLSSKQRESATALSRQIYSSCCER